VYLYNIDNDYVLFDAGLNMGNWPDLFFTSLDKLNISPKNITHCFISHSHLDHIGLIGKLKEKHPNIKIAMHDIVDRKLRWETNPENFEKFKEQVKQKVYEVRHYGISEKQGELLTKFFLKWPRLKNYYKPDLVLHDRDEININNTSLKVIWTPGHSLGHICLFDSKNNYLFSGDHILSRITPHIGIFIINQEIRDLYNQYDFSNILRIYLDSLERIYDLSPNIIFPAHQEIIYNPLKRIKEIQAHHQERMAEISQVIKNNPMSLYKIAQIHFGELDEMNTYLAISEVLAHLRFLVEEGKVEKKQEYNRTLFYC
jgi:glyoxylase-like metal-dependent hydrolase (beta-lactamase superfamily II)